MERDEAVDLEVFERALEEAARRDAKKRKRAVAARRRESLCASYYAEADEAIARRLTSSEVFRSAGTVFCYVSVKGEPDTAQLIDAALGQGKRVAVPRCLGKGVMEAVLIQSREDLSKAGAYGIPEPADGLPVLAPEEIDLSVIPCVACTKDRARLGHGMGYYDRFMEKAAGAKAVLCYEELLFDRLPEEPHDRRPDMVVSEAGIYAE